jgi:uncharacterized protein
MELPVPAPAADPETLPFWAGTARGELLLRRCRECAVVAWPPRTFCPACGAADPEWFAAAGTGEVYSRTIVRKAQGEWRDAVPYVLAYVQLTEGPRILTDVVADDPEEVHIGQSVRVVFHPADNGYALPRFTPMAD